MRLRTADPQAPGLRRERRGRGFRYLDTAGDPLTDPCHLERVRALTIPPAWTDVWICPWPNGHLQALGTDAAHRRQYLYHEEFRARQEHAKHEHVREFAGALPRLREHAATGLARRGLSRERVSACAVRLLDLGFFRIGTRAYARENQTYGLTTMLREHVVCRAGVISFSYPGKSAVPQVRALVDRPAYETVRALLCRRGGEGQLFEYWQGRRWHGLTSTDLNACLKEFAGMDVTAKDFRTWHATVLAAVGLAVSVPASHRTPAARKRAVARVVREVSHYLGNTPAVCRASYINPRLIELFEEGRTIADELDRLGEGAVFGRPATQGPVEEAVLRLLDGG
ncbi:DNA topoisomerase IB [Streptomyces sp. AM 4-1-1]|uniref:DNA topoisomerase IB n=1 Tax=Streptomyces sp. AM 4-1-1 TaxID=3028710 RepID=UPI0023B8A213|nr:DNA topoisomerase IB [Streptomyces sp. AM 4-1-1]WEH35093.1 DNA topoisomerase IB [Streptomyces sp. AM 4-1-1]